MSYVPITLPRSVHRRAAILAARDGVPLDEWLLCAVVQYLAPCEANVVARPATASTADHVVAVCTLP